MKHDLEEILKLKHYFDAHLIDLNAGDFEAAEKSFEIFKTGFLNYMEQKELENKPFSE